MQIWCCLPKQSYSKVSQLNCSELESWLLIPIKLLMVMNDKVITLNSIFYLLLYYYLKFGLHY